MLLCFLPYTLHAQIKIGGNVYGGGNEGDTGGSTTVTIRDGQIKNVFGGARMANVGGRAFVNIDGEHGSGVILIANVYGGNDISGTVGTSIDHNSEQVDAVPIELTDVLRAGETLEQYPDKNVINNSWDAFVRSSTKGRNQENSTHCVLVGSVYGGGNGDYTYSSTDDPNTGKTTHYIYEVGSSSPIAIKETLTGEAGFSQPTLAKTYLEINGGCLSQVYGGGNNATVTMNTTINLNNDSKGLQSLFPAYDPNGTQSYQDYYASLMDQLMFLANYTGLSTFQGDFTSLDYTSSRVFGGNNKVAMAIHPKWNLKKSLIRDLYSGGNQGDMTNDWGLLLEIPATSEIKVENVYGGCRRADVHPDVPNEAALALIQIPETTIRPDGTSYHFPPGYSARLLISGGDIKNVYGGNDISGNVYGGSAVGVYTSIRGDLYGAGNGSYAYTDNFHLKNTPGYGDFYYNVNGILNNGRAEDASFSEVESSQALAIHRPNAERISLRVWGPDAAHPTIIGGSIYVGGNSATLRNDRDPDNTATGELKIGSNVIANNVFLGNNGEHMVTPSVLSIYQETITYNSNTYVYSTMDLTNRDQFAEYMKGCASFIRPAVVFDKKNDDGTGDPDTYQDYSSYFGSFFCGGNIGSMMWPGTAELNFNRDIVIFDKLVAGCNDAYVPVQEYNNVPVNAEYLGGVLGTDAEQVPGAMIETVNGVTKIKNAIVLNLSGLKIEPKRWVVKRNPDYSRVLTYDGKVTYLAKDCGCELSAINDICTHGNHTYLEWNTIDRTGPEVAPVTSAVPANYVSTQEDLDRRLQHGNVYGGCYNSGVVNGSVVINIDETIMHQENLFDVVENDTLGEAILYGAGGLNDLLSQDRQHPHILERRTGVSLGRQGMDVLGKALNIFGGGYGKDTEIWGSTTINHNAGYVFQIFGGSERGVIGKPYDGETGATEYVNFNGSTYLRNSLYSCTVNVRGTKAGVSKQDDSSEEMARAEFIYGGGFMGPICGNTIIHLGNGRVFNTFAGSCMADILGHTETYIGVQVDKQSNEVGEGFPYIRDYIYCGNDLGGPIFGSANFSSRVRSDVSSMVHSANVTNASAYVEYRRGRAEGIFGGCFGTYDYTDPYFGEYFYASDATDIDTDHPAGSARTGYTKPRMGNAFVNFRPTDEDDLLIGANKYNFVNTIYGAGQGYPGDADRDIMQKSSYVLIDIPQRMTNWQNMEVFGAGAWSGLGMDEFIANKTNAQIRALNATEKTAYYASLDAKSAIVDLMRGQVGAAYGGSYAEGVTRRTVVNVPDGSTIRIGSIFGGAYGTETYMPCDVYESNVEYHSAAATLICNPERTDDNGNTIGNPLQNGALYGGNNNERRTLYAKVNIDKRVNQAHYLYGTSRGNVYGAGKGGNTWAEYTEVNLNNGAEVYEVYGGGQAGKVLCAEAITAYQKLPQPSVWPAGSHKEGETFTADDFANAWKIGGGYDPVDGNNDGTVDAYWETTATNLANPLVRLGDVDDRDWSELHQDDWDLIINKYNTNVIIHEGAYVANYAYAAGLGEEAQVGGHTYIALLGGTVNKDIYAGGTSGPVEDTFGAGNYHISGNREGFEATTTAYIEGGTVRNVYGGGWRGAVGYHPGDISATYENDILGTSHVVVGKRNGTSYIDGIPSITRNVYGGGEGGAIFGKAHVRINNGYIGYRYNANASDDASTTDFDERYIPELDDAAPGDNLLDKGGNVFGGGYVANSYVDFTDVKMYGGNVRGCVFGGGEIGPVGRGTTKNAPEGIIYKAGESDVRIYDGHVMRDVFGGGRGYDNWNGSGWMSAEEQATMDLSSKGYVFGKTFVYIRGGEIGTEDGVAKGFGNVFGGGDRGFIFSASLEDEYYTQAECDAYNTANNLTQGMTGYRTTADVKTADKTYIGKKSGVRYNVGLTNADPTYNDNGYYYKYDGTNFVLSPNTQEKLLTEDCKVVLGPQCKVKDGETVTLTGIFYPKKAPIPPVDIAYLKANNITGFNAKGIVTADEGITIASRTYEAGDYIPTYALQTMGPKTDTRWAALEDDGIIIHNAVFAGGNVSSGDDQVYANAPTVFGNATASIHDIYHRDLITIGTGHVGGLYGDGNLTFVDGYRGLNITNYGTDYQNLNPDISYADYLLLTEREKAYYELKYKCATACTDNQNNNHPAGEIITSTDLLVLFEGIDEIIDPTTHAINSTYWVQNGVCSRYAGRIMNTIQRADFCGVFGSRLVLQGAPDRVPETVDYTNYTINRVREVSLNKKNSIIPADASTKDAYHGNYFGIYSIVNHLGAITSDVNMTDVRKTENDEYKDDITVDGTTYAYGDEGATWYNWKKANVKDRKRNRGSSHNEVALASGVYLELTTELSTGKGVNEIDWGYITGVVELDLINVQTGVGGGYVYAKNVHGTRSATGYKHITLAALNNDAVTRRDYQYSDDYDPDASDMVEWEVSGNFVHDTQTIIDDCYDVTNSYKGSDRSPAHYWYIKGQVYIYDQYISAYTGSPAAYKETVHIPLTITAASHGKLKLVNIQPNHYAYYKDYASNTVLGSNDQLELNFKTYGLNDPIDYWEYSLLSSAEKALFVSETYTTIAACTINGVTYPKGKVMLPSDYTSLKNTVTTNHYTVHNDETNEDVDFDFIFRKTNNISHDTGYILTYDVNNPMEWNDWYTPIAGTNPKINTEQYGELTDQAKADYYDGPTYSVISGQDGIYGQRSYEVSNIIDSGVYNTYQNLVSNYPSAIPANQGTFEQAYIVTVDEVEAHKITGTDAQNNPTYTNIKLYKGASLAMSEYTTGNTWPSELNGRVAPAYVATATAQVNSEYIYTGDLMTLARRTELINAATTAGNTELATMLTNSIVPAYYCTEAGLYGGDYYSTGNNYRGLEAWSSMSAEDRAKFTFNYDALDVLIDPNFSGSPNQKYQYDGAGFTTETQAETNPAKYSLKRPVDYTAYYNSPTALTLDAAVNLKRDVNGTLTNMTSSTIQENDQLTRETYESLPNEQYHYASIAVQKAGDIYIVNNSFVRGETPFAAGQIITADEYNNLGDNQNDVTVLTFDAGDVGNTYYYCHNEYTPQYLASGQKLKSIKGSITGEYTNGQTVPVGAIIAQETDGVYTGYEDLVNKQLHFTIHGTAPVETSTLYVSRNSDIYDLSEDKIITVIYQYDYEESDETGMHITPVSERHIVNIHLQFKSGIPTVETITAPDLVLPGTNVVIRTPNVTPGAYEVLGGGWEIYHNATDAENHANGMDYSPTASPLYWYQDGYHVAYYAKTYLGKTYSNAVPLSVANYHDLKKVMEDKEHHYYIDNNDVKRDPKIYINDYTTNDPATTANGLELLKDFFELTTHQRTYNDVEVNGLMTQVPNKISTDPTDPLYNHIGIETSQVGNSKNLEFFLRTDLAAPTASGGNPAWTAIGSSTNCFEGTLHGDGHVISGLDNSLFSYLCGEVYNLGITGSFTSAGLADEGTGFVENCWVKSTATAATDTKAVFHNPTNTSGTNPRTVHVVNCYYPNTSGFTAQTGTKAKSESAFYNGEVTYDLNEFYLFKRYCDNNTSTITSNDYTYWKDVDGTLTQQTGHYESVAGPYLVNDIEGNYIGSYVESRFNDGDFIYATGSIPGSADIRFDNVAKKYYPIWPDDYFFFGQVLNYGHETSPAHQALPSPIMRNGDRLPNASSAITGNRVYRAPAYYRSLAMGVAHFNPAAIFAQTKKNDATLIAHKNMTAIDFTGGNGDLASGYQRSWNDAVTPSSTVPGGLPERFYPPLLDDDGLFSIKNIDLTRNLLVYTGTTGGTGVGETPTATQQTANIVGAYLLDQSYAEGNATGTGYVAGKAAYHTVGVYDTHSEKVLGHWVQGNGGTYTAPRDHMLVDKNDFNAPLQYTFANGKRMWYQRTPDNFVDRTKGWEGISVPFAAEIVTTQTKGELTHFYKTTVTDSKGVNVGSTGHEYWLRCFTSGGSTENDEYKANFTYPDAGTNVKDYTNTFLWDYYYQYAASTPRQDENKDKYQQTYYASTHTFSDYPYSIAAKPYIIGFPGTTYYEFDLSGTFIPDNTRDDDVQSPPAKLAKQTVTLASPTGVTIRVSDSETLPGGDNWNETTTDGFTFMPSYLNTAIPAPATEGNTTTTYYTLNANGSAFTKVAATGTSVLPFRPYFKGEVTSAPVKPYRAITFGRVDDTQFGGSDEQSDPDDGLNGELKIKTKRGRIIVTSSLSDVTTVRIISASGALIRTFKIEPGQTIETQVITGIYLVNQTKVAVK